jgi:hypothetical protein
MKTKKYVTAGWNRVHVKFAKSFTETAAKRDLDASKKYGEEKHISRLSRNGCDVFSGCLLLPVN